MTLWTVALHASLSMGFSRQEYWSGLPFSSPVELPDPAFELRSPTWWAESLPFEPQGNPVNPCSLPKSRQLICGRTGTGIPLLTPGPLYFIKWYSHLLRVFEEKRMPDVKAMHKLWNNPNAIQWLLTCVNSTQWSCAIKSKNMIPNAFQK